jgi:hypothetical protein
MAIVGSIILEDLNIQFQITKDNQADYTVTDCQSGEQESKTVDGPLFMRALGAALDFDGGSYLSSKQYEQCESVQPDNPVLRFIP